LIGGALGVPCRRGVAVGAPAGWRGADGISLLLDPDHVTGPRTSDRPRPRPVPSTCARRSRHWDAYRCDSSVAANPSLNFLSAFRACFCLDRRRETGPTSASEDFGAFGVQWHEPSVFWFVGGTDPDVHEKVKAAGRVSELPTNHDPRFAPVLHPTIESGVATLVVASRAWLANSADR